MSSGLLLIWATLFAFVVTQPAPPINNVLTIQGPNVAGGCTQAQQTIIDRWWTEAYDLARTIEIGLASVTTDRIARNMLTLYMGINFSPQTNEPISDADTTNFNTVKNFFNRVLDVMEGTRILGPDLVPIPAAQIFLYCNSNWATYKSRSSQAQDANGNYMIVPGTNRPLPINAIPRYAQAIADNLYPYWVPTANEYIFEPQYPGSPRSYCNLQDNLAGTQDANIQGSDPERPLLPYTLTICPAAFIPSDQTGQALLGGTQPVTGHSIINYKSTGLTLFHELFHLALNTLATVDVYDDFAGCIGAIVGSNANPAAPEGKNVRHSPECYTILANAYYNSLLAWPAVQPGAQGLLGIPQRWDFSTGNAVPYY